MPSDSCLRLVQIFDYNMGSRAARFSVLLVLLVWCGVAQADVDPVKKTNHDATEADYWQWVTTVETNHLTASPPPATVSTQSDVSTQASTSTKTLYVGGGGYKTVQAAVDAASSSGGRTIIQIASGTYWSNLRFLFSHLKFIQCNRSFAELTVLAQIRFKP